jgi:NAD(P) transhydrogenase
VAPTSAVARGWVGLTDRIETLGGPITLHNPPGAGTTPQMTLLPDRPAGRASSTPRERGLMFGVVVDRTASIAVYGLPEVAGAGATEEEVRAAGIAYVVGRCDLALTARGAIAGHGGLLKLIIRADDRTLLGVHCFGDIAAEVVNLGHVVVQGGGGVESFLTMALATPTYGYAYHDAAVDGLTQLSRLMGLAGGGAPGVSAP